MKAGRLSVFWSKREQDFLMRFPSKPDGHLLWWWFGCEHHRYDHDAKGVVFDQSFIAELEARGYDTKTLRFSVDRKATTT